MSKGKLRVSGTCCPFSCYSIYLILFLTFIRVFGFFSSIHVCVYVCRLFPYNKFLYKYLSYVSFLFFWSKIPFPQSVIYVTNFFLLF